MPLLYEVCVWRQRERRRESGTLITVYLTWQLMVDGGQWVTSHIKLTFLLLCSCLMVERGCNFCACFLWSHCLHICVACFFPSQLYVHFTYQWLLLGRNPSNSIIDERGAELCFSVEQEGRVIVMH